MSSKNELNINGTNRDKNDAIKDLCVEIGDIAHQVYPWTQNTLQV